MLFKRDLVDSILAGKKTMTSKDNPKRFHMILIGWRIKPTNYKCYNVYDYTGKENKKSNIISIHPQISPLTFGRKRFSLLLSY